MTAYPRIVDKAGLSPKALKGDSCKTGGHRAAQKGDLKDRLSRYSEIDLSVTGRKSGRTISQPVWFVWDNDRLYLLPVKGSDTQWYKNALKNPAVRIDARGAEAEFNAVPIRSDGVMRSLEIVPGCPILPRFWEGWVFRERTRSR